MKNPWIWTYTARNFALLNPRGEDISIEDIAHALSHLCRFNGHTKEFYSVAQHSVLASWLAPREFKLEALMHDAAEAYVGDLTSPMKKCPGLTNPFFEIEKRIDQVIRSKYGLPREISEEVRKIDKDLATSEAWELLGDGWQKEVDHLLDGELVPITIRPWSSAMAKRSFLQSFETYDSQAYRNAADIELEVG